MLIENRRALLTRPISAYGSQAIQRSKPNEAIPTDLDIKGANITVMYMTLGNKCSLCDLDIWITLERIPFIP